MIRNEDRSTPVGQGLVPCLPRLVGSNGYKRWVVSIQRTLTVVVSIQRTLTVVVGRFDPSVGSATDKSW
jgi:hypothetical protein